MEESLVQALAQCMDQNTSTRQYAEAHIASLKSQPGFTLLLMKLSLSESLTIPIRQLAAILLKNHIFKWKKCEVSEEDKGLIKGALIGCLKLSVPEQIRAQYEEVSLAITKVEYPWQGLHDLVDSYLDSNDPDLVYAALLLLSKTAKNYEFVMTEKRSRLKQLISAFFGKLEALFGRLLTEGNSNALIYINLVLQIYWYSFYIELPPEQATEAGLDSWLHKFHLILQMEYDSELPIDHYAAAVLDKSPKLQCKKWACQILHRFFSRYHDQAHQMDTNLIISQVFATKWAVPVLQTIVLQLFKYPSVYISDILKNYSLKYISQAVKYGPTCEFLKTMQTVSSQLVLPSLLTDIITPMLCITPYDQELWQDNPIEFIRKGADLGNAFYSSVNAATDLLETLCKKGYLQQFLDYLSFSLSKPPTPLEKEALIYEVGSVSAVLLESEVLSGKVQDMLSAHVFAELSSENGFLRARACWAYGKFASVPFSSEDHQRAALEQICKLLMDNNLPVKYEAGLTVPKILSWDISKARIRGEIQNLLKIYLDLINEIDSEEIIEALEEIVSHFSEEVGPFAVDLVQQLCITFAKLASRELADDNGDSAMAAVSILNTVARLVETIADKSEELIKVSHCLSPLLQHCLEKKGFEFMEEALKILCMIIKNAPAGAVAHLYGLCKITFASLLPSDAYGIEKTEEIYPVLANFIAKYPELIKPDLNEIMNVVAGMFGQEIRVQKLGCRIISVLVEHLKAEVAPYLLNLLPGIFNLFQITASSKLKIAICQMIFVVIWSDIQNMVSFLNSSGQLQIVIEYSLMNSKNFKEKISRIQALLGLSALLPLIPGVLTNFNMVVAGKMLSTIVEFIKLVEEEEAEEESDEEIDTSGKEFNEKCEELYKKMQDKLEESDDSKDIFENEANDLYDSEFETNDYKGYFREMISKCLPDLVAPLVNSLEFQHKAIFSRIINS